MHAIDDSLRRLGMDYVDLYQIHRFDPTTPIEETLEALNDVVKAGKALYIGASSMYAWQFAKMLAHVATGSASSRFVTMQNHYNLVYREEEREMLPLCRDEGIGLIPWSPLARGFLAGNRRDGRTRARRRARKSDDFAHTCTTRDDDFEVVERVTEIAQKRGVPNAQVALAWLLPQPGVTAPIVGATKPHHLDDAVAALSTSSSTPTRSRRWRSPTSRTRCSGTGDQRCRSGASVGARVAPRRVSARTRSFGGYRRVSAMGFSAYAEVPGVAGSDTNMARLPLPIIQARKLPR